VDNAAELSAADRALLIQPPGLTSAKELLRIATTPQQQAAAPLPAGAVMTAPSDGLGEDRPEGQAGASWGSKSFLLVWADTAEPVRLTPSVLLAHLILCSRRVCSCSACMHCHVAAAAWAFAFPDACLSSACLPARQCVLIRLPLAAQTLEQSSGTSTACMLMTTNAQHSKSLVYACLLSAPQYAICSMPCIVPKSNLSPSNTGAIAVCCQVTQVLLVCRKQACSCAWHLAWATVRWETTWPVCSSSSGAVDTGTLSHQLHSFTSLFGPDPFQAMAHVKQVAAARCTSARNNSACLQSQ